MASCDALGMYMYQEYLSVVDSLEIVNSKHWFQTLLTQIIYMCPDTVVSWISVDKGFIETTDIAIPHASTGRLDYVSEQVFENVSHVHILMILGFDLYKLRLLKLHSRN